MGFFAKWREKERKKEKIKLKLKKEGKKMTESIEKYKERKVN